MGKTADNEKMKLRASFLNNIAAGLAVTAIAASFLGFFINGVQTIPILESFVNGDLSLFDPKVRTIMNPFGAAILAFGLCMIFRLSANRALEKIQD